MADFYSEMAQVTADLLAPTDQGGLGQGTVELSRELPATPGPNPWDPVTPNYKEETLRAAVFGVGKELVGKETGGTVILASDRHAICAVPEMQYTAGDTLRVDGVPVTVISVENIPEAGTASAVRFIIRGG